MVIMIRGGNEVGNLRGLSFKVPVFSKKNVLFSPILFGLKNTNILNILI